VDVGYFLNGRIVFIRQLYVTATREYVERQRKIEAEEEPFVPLYSEDGEPPFLEEWLEADDSLQVLGRACVSMLAATLKLYFKAWERELGIPVDSSLKSEFDRGFVNGYRAYFLRHFGIRFDDGPTNVAILEEIVLARNNIQHPETITSNHSHYSDSDLKKLPHPFLVDDREKSLLAEVGESQNPWLMSPTIHVSPDKLLNLLSEIERFAEWLEHAEVSHGGK
jgi:hypothetical protein